MPTAAENTATYLPTPTTTAPPEAPARLVRLFRNGANQALRIPKEFELPGKEAELRQVGNTLVITPIAPPKATLAQLLGSWNDIEDDFPDLDEGLLPLDDIDLGPA